MPDVGGIRVAEAAWEQVRTVWAEVADLSHALAVLSWDELVNLPPGGAVARAEQKATLGRLIHQRLAAADLGEALARLAALPQGSPRQRAWLRLAEAERRRAVRVPADLVVALSRAESEGYVRWIEARERREFSRFAPALERLIALRRQEGEALAQAGDDPYAALLDQYEPGADVAQVAALLTDLRAALVPLLAQVASRPPLDPSPLRRAVPPKDQLRCGDLAAAAFGFDARRGRRDRSVHPFSTGLGAGDVRITTRIDPSDFASGFFATLHETGHALQDQGIPDGWWRGPGVASGRLIGSHGIAESQSRLWECGIGRSLPYWEHWLPVLQRQLPGRFDGLDPEDAYRAANVVQPSAIRVTADELTYNLHIILRFELERALVAGDLPVQELPAAWNRQMESLLGVRPADDLEGCLQDVHWSSGSFGYFPTYTLGNLLAAQLLEAARRRLGDLDGLVRNGNFAPLLEWLRQDVHQRAPECTPAELIETATGGPLTADAYLGSMRAKFGELYGL